MLGVLANVFLESAAADVRLVRLEGVKHGARDWRQDFDVKKLPGLTPRLPWAEQLDPTLIQTWLKKALEQAEEEGQTFTLSAEPSYRDFDHVVEQAYAIPILRELRVGFQHKTAVKGVVQEFLETRTFNLPAGLPVSFEKVIAEGAASRRIEDLFRRHERLPLVPQPGGTGFHVADLVDPAEQFRDAVPLYDLAVKAGAFGAPEQPEAKGWARLPNQHLDDDMFVAKVAGRSMEPGIVDGAYGLFRSFPVGKEPSLTALDNRRVIVQLTGTAQDPETGRYTLKRWRVSKRAAGGEVEEVTLSPDNGAFQPIRLTPADGDLRVVAEFLETVG